MNRYYTVMIVPEKEKRIVSFRVPQFLFRSFSVILVVIVFMIIIFAYDYKQILNQVYENKHLSLENRKLRDQLNIFHMKINTLTHDIQQIQTFEKKLRIITGIEQNEIQSSDSGGFKNPSTTSISPSYRDREDKLQVPSKGQSFHSPELVFDQMGKDQEFLQIKELYRKKMSQDFSISSHYSYSKTWSDLAKRTFLLAGEFATFEFKYNKLKNFIKNLEMEVHEIDQFLLDKESFLRSTPTILPTKGWITSFYGPRNSPYTGRLKMHEGLDIGAQIGTQILAPADGIITYSGHKPGFGNFVQIDHGYGIETIFGHAKSLLAQNGQRVKRGNVIARVGNTGLSTGPHVHYEVRVNGIAVDPFYFVLD